MKIEILGPGCARCHATERNVQQAIDQMNIPANVNHIYDQTEFAKRGVFFTPALVIDGTLKVSGRIPSVEEIKTYIEDMIKAPQTQ